MEIAARPPAIDTNNSVGTFGLASPPARGASASGVSPQAVLLDSSTAAAAGTVGNLGPRNPRAILKKTGKYRGAGVARNADGSSGSNGSSGGSGANVFDILSGEPQKIAILSALATEASDVVRAGTLTPFGLRNLSPPARGATPSPLASGGRGRSGDGGGGSSRGRISLPPRRGRRVTAPRPRPAINNADFAAAENNFELSSLRRARDDGGNTSSWRVGDDDDDDYDDYDDADDDHSADERISNWQGPRMASSKPFTSSGAAKPYSTAGSHQRGLSSPTSRVREAVVTLDSVGRALPYRPRDTNGDSEEEEKRPEKESDEDEDEDDTSDGVVPTRGSVFTGGAYSASRSVIRSSAAAAAAAASDRPTQDGGVGGSYSYSLPTRGVKRANARRWSALGANKAVAASGTGGGVSGGGRRLSGGGGGGGGGDDGDTTALARPVAVPSGSPGAKGDGPPPPPSRMQEQRRRSSIPLTEGLLPIGAVGAVGAGRSSLSMGVSSNARRRSSLQLLGAWMAGGAVEAGKSFKLPSSPGARDVRVSAAAAAPGDDAAPYTPEDSPAMVIGSPRARGGVAVV